MALATLVDAVAVVPRLRLDIRYATTDNFTHHKLYAQARCRLQTEVAARLAEVQRELARRRLGLLAYDCYRPLSVQKQMWALVPDERYVSDPAKGSRHNRGAAVDVTLVDERGRPLPMPSAYDEFSERAVSTRLTPSPVGRRDAAQCVAEVTHEGERSDGDAGRERVAATGRAPVERGPSACDGASVRGFG